ncbi:hypothetical protein [Mycoplasma phocoeninasale]|uniref:Uncharacterized protein n=1 Tax=Mycoplasma phocoeninasale TaxID=2726117 RepID=A0A858U482_9MOLU|nr:hypothetical protein [Mycoplasma phocoeninasale]MBN0970684.1 hypothetical protein [Mycoplasma phocoeninasale]QJG66207.1 hypothetical protein HGG64_00520 [Mycoplasma phocoeninasale]
MAKILNAQKQKDTRTLTYDPEKDNLSLLINEFHAFKKTAKFAKNYSEAELYALFQQIRWMKIMDEKNENIRKDISKRQYKITSKYENYIEFKNWSDSPLAQKARPISVRNRILIIAGIAAIVIFMLLIIVGLNKWW